MNGFWTRLTSLHIIKKPLDDPDESLAVKSLRRNVGSAPKPRKSMSQLFSSNRKHSTWSLLSDADETQQLTCEEQIHYPVYDPENPEHNPQSQTYAKENDKVSQPHASWSPMKAVSLRERMRARSWSRSRSRSPSLAKDRFGLETLARSIRAAAGLLYSDGSQEREAKRGTGGDAARLACNKDVTSKTTTQYSSDPFHGSLSPPKSSPIFIPSKCPPCLPQIGATGAFNFDTTFEDTDLTACTAGPPKAPVENLAIPKSVSSRSALRVCLDAIAANKNRFPSQHDQTPGAELVLQNPFGDAANILDKVENAMDECGDGLRDKKAESVPLSNVPESDFCKTSNPLVGLSEDFGNVPDKDKPEYPSDDESNAEFNINPHYYDTSTTPTLCRSGLVSSEDWTSTQGMRNPHPRISHSLCEDANARARSVTESYDAGIEISDCVYSSASCPIQGVGLTEATQGTRSLRSSSGKDDQHLNSRKILFHPICESILDEVVGSTTKIPGFRAEEDKTKDNVLTHLGVLQAETEVASSFSLPSAYSTELSHSGDQAENPSKGGSPRTQSRSLEDSAKVSKADDLNGESPHESSADPIKGKPPLQRVGSPVFRTDRIISLADDDVSVLNLSPTVSSESPPSKAQTFCFSATSEEIPDVQHVEDVEYSWHIRPASERMPEDKDLQPCGFFDSTLQPISRHLFENGTNSISSSANLICSSTSSPKMKRDEQTSFPLLLEWNPFQEPRFVLLAQKMQAHFPADFQRLLLSEGISPRLWRSLDLESTNGPPEIGLTFNLSQFLFFSSHLETEASILMKEPSKIPRLSIRQKMIARKLDSGRRLALFDDVNAFESDTMQYSRLRHKRLRSFGPEDQNFGHRGRRSDPTSSSYSLETQVTGSDHHESYSRSGSSECSGVTHPGCGSENPN